MSISLACPSSLVSVVFYIPQSYQIGYLVYCVYLVKGRLREIEPWKWALLYMGIILYLCTWAVYPYMCRFRWAEWLRLPQPITTIILYLYTWAIYPYTWSFRWDERLRLPLPMTTCNGNSEKLHDASISHTFYFDPLAPMRFYEELNIKV